jgi:hypothetical protein
MTAGPSGQLPIRDGVSIWHRCRWIAYLIAATIVGITAAATAVELPPQLPDDVRLLLEDHCLTCHDSQEKSGGIDLQRHVSEYRPNEDMALWVKVESVITSGKMPPEDESPLSIQQKDATAKWFEVKFVKPGGRQHPGVGPPRRLTREELQNTLEDILHVELRATVTNSRLHVIPDTIIEKFFGNGVQGASGFSNDAKTLAQEPIDIQTYARCFSSVLDLIDANEQAQEQLFNGVDLSHPLPSEVARQIIGDFGKAAYRRSMSNAELDAFVRVYSQLSAERSTAKSLKSSFLAILLSPPFLFRIEETKPDQVPVVGMELATRLSYFLWSAPPDETLLALAEMGKLRHDAVLREQVRRMLSDPRRIALAENLGGEWFDYKKLRQKSAVNKRSDKMAGFYRTQYEEALLFFDSVIRFNESIYRLVDADWAFTNRHQAGIYGQGFEPTNQDATTLLPPINLHYRDASRRVADGNYEYKHAPLTLTKIGDRDRGGLMTLGPTMSATATENRTSPIRRGVWVLERILGVHFEVPEDVPDLEATQKRAKSLALELSDNEILKLHSSQEGCAACHKLIDPLGFGLEVFDQLGIRRTIVDQNPVGQRLKWSPTETPAKFAERTWELQEPLNARGEHRIHFQWTTGRHRLDIRNLRLISGDLELSDPHHGFTGSANRDNVWLVTLPPAAPSDGWKLVAEVKGDGGTDSNGTITISGPNDEQPGFAMPNGNAFKTPRELKLLLLSDYQAEITDNAIRRVLAYALGRDIRPIDRPAIDDIRLVISRDEYRLNTLIEEVALSYPFRHKESAP